MKLQRLAVVVTVLNLAILMLNLTGVRSLAAPAVADVLRGHALEIVDDRKARDDGGWIGDGARWGRGLYPTVVTGQESPHQDRGC
jgi:hypothetical protein